MSIKFHFAPSTARRVTTNGFKDTSCCFSTHSKVGARFREEIVLPICRSQNTFNITTSVLMMSHEHFTEENLQDRCCLHLCQLVCFTNQLKLPRFHQEGHHFQDASQTPLCQKQIVGITNISPAVVILAAKAWSVKWLQSSCDSPVRIDFPTKCHWWICWAGGQVSAAVSGRALTTGIQSAGQSATGSKKHRWSAGAKQKACALLTCVTGYVKFFWADFEATSRTNSVLV